MTMKTLTCGNVVPFYTNGMYSDEYMLHNAALNVGQGTAPHYKSWNTMLLPFMMIRNVMLGIKMEHFVCPPIMK